MKSKIDWKHGAEISGIAEVLRGPGRGISPPVTSALTSGGVRRTITVNLITAYTPLHFTTR